MDAETRLQIEALQRENAEKSTKLAEMDARLDALWAVLYPPAENIVSLKEAAARLGISTEAARRRALRNPAIAQKIGGRWAFKA